MNKIYILKHEKYLRGPYSLEILKEKGLKSTDKIWFDGLAEWMPAKLLASEGVSLITPPPRKRKKGILSFIPRSHRNIYQAT
ncbi:MAG: hypothetical protein JWQ96_2329 [Segetibacter sp.]|nr:hypothetical protein [Segetibacter sp.]